MLEFCGAQLSLGATEFKMPKELKNMTNQKPKISVITVCLNAESAIKKTVKSVLCQKYDDYEYLIIDGDSSD